MKRSATIFLSTATIMVLAGTYLGMSMRNDRETASIDALETAGPGPLDGMVFAGLLGPEGQKPDVPDRFVFNNGTFVSKECELRCDYPARPYQASESSGVWTFTSTTRCPYKDATIVWNGTVADDRITGVATWTIRRWYWTVERDFAFEATLDPHRADQAQAD